MKKGLGAGTCVLTATAFASACFGPSRTTFHERPAETTAMPLRTPLTLVAELEYVRFVRNGERLKIPPAVVVAFAKDWDDAGIFRAVSVRAAESVPVAGDETATLRLEIDDVYRRNALANIGKMLLGLVTLYASSSALPVTADLEQTMRLELVLPTGTSTTYSARSSTTRSMPVASPTEDAAHWSEVASTNLTSLLRQVRAYSELRKWEPSPSSGK